MQTKNVEIEKIYKKMMTKIIVKYIIRIYEN